MFVMSTGSKEDPRERKQFVFDAGLKIRISVLNIVSKPDTRQTSKMK